MSTPGDRKKRHLEICLNENAEITGGYSYLQEVRFLHRSMPERNWDELDISRNFLGYSLAAPFYVSPMTGGVEEGDRVNLSLAKAAGQLRIPFASGSLRALLKDPGLYSQFDLKPLLPKSPYLLNIGAQELKYPENRDRLLDLSTQLKADGITVHLNPGQELFQREGERDFRGIKDSLRIFIKACPLPVIIKETGCGIHPAEVLELLEAGAAWVDLAGSGGSNWILVEGIRQQDSGALPFEDWGHPSLLGLAALKEKKLPLLASGGYRNGMDAAKGLALGAELVGFARPLLRPSQRGIEEIIGWMKEQILLLKRILLLTGSANLEELKKNKIWLSSSMQRELDEYKRSCFE